MAMHDLGYRRWCGQLASGSSRWIVIANTGARRAWQSKWLRRMLFFAWLPALWFGVGFFIWEQSMLNPEWREGMDPFIEEMPFAGPMASIRSGASDAVEGRELDEAHGIVLDPLQHKDAELVCEVEWEGRWYDAKVLKKKQDSWYIHYNNDDESYDEWVGKDRIRFRPIEGPVASRHAVWSWLLQSFFRYSQGAIMVLVVGIIAPPLISQDVRSRAFLLYFSRPITRSEYVLGKSATLWFYLAMITTAPALSLYVLGILLSPNYEVILATWDLPLRILAASVVLMLPTAALALCISSMTEESRYAGFAWFAIWIMGWFTYGMLTSFEGVIGTDGDVTRWTYLSLYHTLGQVQSWIFGFADFSDTEVAAGILIVVTAVSLIILFNRVSAPMRT